MRVAIDARSLNERSTSNRTYWSELVRALGRRTDVELLLASNAPLASEDVPANAEAVVVPASGRLFSLATLPKIVRERWADVVHVQYTVSPLFRVPVVTSIHDVSFFVEPAWFGAKDRFLLQRTIPFSCQQATRVLAPSEATRAEILKYIDVSVDKLMTVPLGTPTELAGIETDGGIAAELVAHLVGERPYALLVGGASPRKNLAGAIEAVRLARETIPELVLLVTGHLPEPPKRSWIVAPGPLDEPALAAAYRGAHALLHPSYHEGFGFTVLEAMTLGLPVVCSDRGSLPEVVGDAAILCDPNDARGMAEGLRRLLDRWERRDLVEKGRMRAAAFSWDATAEGTVQAYRHAVG